MITIREVVVNIACLASDLVFLIAKANDIAPRNPTVYNANGVTINRATADGFLPAKNSMCWKFKGIFGCLPKLSRNDKGYTFAARPMAAQI